VNEAEVLFTELLACDRVFLYQNRALTLDREKCAFVAGVLRKRMRGEPLQYILGNAEFMGLEFKVNPAVLIPRPETEILVEAAVKQFSVLNRKPSVIEILDIGTGSGCIAISLAKNLANAKIDAIDVSEEALAVARENAALNRVEVNFFQADLFNRRADTPGFSPRRFMTYDLIISNPPYIPTAEIDRLQPEIAHEPRIALDGGGDGLIFYSKIIEVSKKHLKNNGFLMLEIGFGQAEMIKNILQNSGIFMKTEIIKDYQGLERVIITRKGK